MFILVHSSENRWDGGPSVSSVFGVSNGVRPGGHIATVLFNHCSNDLSDKLNACSTECMIGSFKVNHLMYADDSGIFGPSSSGLQKRLNVCSSYGLKNDVLYNANKSALLIVRTKAGVT